MNRFSGVPDTLYIPLTARIYVSKHFPDYFMDEKALSLEPEMPYETIAAKSTEYFQMAGACRFYCTDQMIRSFIHKHGKCNVINLGCGLETAYFRLLSHTGEAVFYEVDLPSVIEMRRRILGESEREILIAGDMFDFEWTKGIDTQRPTILTAIGVFQYFESASVTVFLKEIQKHFTDAEVIFDAMTGKAVKYANDYIRKTGNKNAELHFSTDSGAAVAGMCGMQLAAE